MSNVLAPKHKHNFEEYINELDEIGYNSYYKVMNARLYGTPQHRDRIFVLSVRKDIEVDKFFIFPEPIELNRVMKELLEVDVDEKCYLTEAQIKRIHTTTYSSGASRIQYKDWCDTLCARDWKDPKCVDVEGRIRKLTPREYWRIMGFSDEDYQKAEDLGLSNFALYKQAGNSIALNVITEILRNIKNQYGEAFSKDCSYLSLFSGVGAFEMALKKI